MKKREKKKNKILLLIGLGNPGDQYCKTRHNAGFTVIDYLADKKNISLKKKLFKPVQIGDFFIDDTRIIIAKPLTYMNLSGRVVPYLLRRFSIPTESLYIICDNIDLPPGMLRLKSGGSSAGHNGIKSIIEAIGETGFNRMYIGVGRPLKSEDLAEHVLGKFNKEELLLFNKASSLAGEALLSIPSKSLNKVMNEINKKNH